MSDGSWRDPSASVDSMIETVPLGSDPTVLLKASLFTGRKGNLSGTRRSSLLALDLFGDPGEKLLRDLHELSNKIGWWILTRSGVTLVNGEGSKTADILPESLNVETPFLLAEVHQIGQVVDLTESDLSTHEEGL